MAIIKRDIASFMEGQDNPTQKSLSTDAWYRPKSVIDVSLASGVFTEQVPEALWKESLDAVEQTSFVNAVSTNGKLVLTSGLENQKVKLDSFRNPRYEPNRGHIYSSSMFLPSKDNTGQRSFGLFTEEGGVGFRLRDGVLYAFRRTKVNSVVSDTEEVITLPEGLDLEKGNIFDIQFQWRGVGDYFFFINNKLVLHQKLLGTLTELSNWNPALPIAYECINQGQAVSIECGCVDVSTEGGDDRDKSYGSISVPTASGSVAIPGPATFDTPILVVKNKEVVNGNINTRDALSLLLTAYSDQKSVVRVWATRDETAITLNDQSYTDFRDGHLEYVIYDNPDVVTPISFDTSKASLIFGARLDQDTSYATSALFEGRTDIYQTPGDIFIFTVHRDNGGAANVGVTYEFAEAI